MRSLSWILTCLLGACSMSGWPADASYTESAPMSPTAGPMAADVQAGTADDAAIESSDGLSSSSLAGAFSNDASGDGVLAETLLDNPSARGPDASTQDPLAGPVASGERMLIYSGRYVVAVAKVETAMTDFLQQVVAIGGFLQQQDESTLTVRVPAAQFESAVAIVQQCGSLIGTSRHAADVTEEFVDLGIRLDNARRARERLLEVLQKAEAVTDILAVEQELRRLTEEIERIEGRLKLLHDRIALATLTVTFVARADAPPARVVRSRFRWLDRVGMRAIMEVF